MTVYHLDGQFGGIPACRDTAPHLSATALPTTTVRLMTVASTTARYCRRRDTAVTNDPCSMPVACHCAARLPRIPRCVVAVLLPYQA